ncbi:hypothetical protein [Umezawaea sp. Da 62-37]|uniref:hypothetical protein n=1 Tax=Umezawaea sp. Da 62-37 TaxID=3075927 RepID=UPI0028F6E292|nr:hypothetical protein [Umezawaea sp. Da 62-37]WNV82570.1 hypothetical protein RM788_30750 [Umezawaea sp. Da 62-37]
MKTTLNAFATPGYLLTGVVCVSPMELAAGRKSARVRHAQPWSAERGLLIQVPTANTVVTSGVTTTDNSIDAPSAHERSRT